MDTEFWDNVWHARIQRNTEIFEKALHTLPTNHVETWQDVCVEFFVCVKESCKG